MKKLVLATLLVVLTGPSFAGIEIELRPDREECLLVMTDDGKKHRFPKGISIEDMIQALAKYGHPTKNLREPKVVPCAKKTLNRATS